MPISNMFGHQKQFNPHTGLHITGKAVLTLNSARGWPKSKVAASVRIGDPKKKLSHTRN